MTPETGSAAAEGLMLSAGEPLAVSTWTEVELLSALGLKIRTNQLTLTEAQLVLDAYRRLVSPNLQRLPVEDADHQRAADFLGG